ncbi:hypothetical protein SOVF_192290 [Spinacia oleracea]|nr:hypothetical protein SOVF_192290 [Spinacia oleracea]
MSLRVVNGLWAKARLRRSVRDSAGVSGTTWKKRSRHGFQGGEKGGGAVFSEAH